MEEIRQTHQLRLVVYPVMYRVEKTLQVVVQDFVHQKYEGHSKHPDSIPNQNTCNQQ